MLLLENIRDHSMAITHFLAVYLKTRRGYIPQTRYYKNNKKTFFSKNVPFFYYYFTISQNDVRENVKKKSKSRITNTGGLGLYD